MDTDFIQKLEIRVRQIESWRDTVNAVGEERRENEKAEFARIHARLDRMDGEMTNGFGKINGHISKLVWLVLAGIVSAVLGFIIRGGMNVVG